MNVVFNILFKKIKVKKQLNNYILILLKIKI